ncbi:hypothetical protein U6A24_03655 [Aquimarina gracilis]|uniref:Uncharacterized protein n=1 Tax=Aquimarina gracilis TaxID=874422 RepID=A0ABU5ZR42_9FLAO|nr:hypothetical protein [Aquimarina gracilis]MEB3344540.1 hypothetical protein [Aquimarina gracilis]
MEERFKDIEQLVKEAGLNQPSSVFSKNVMSQIGAITQKKQIVYTPLISKKTWIIIAVLLLVLVLGIAFLSDSNTSILNTLDLSFLKLDTIKINNPLAGFKFHKTTVYGILFLTALFFIQIPILKRRIDKSF